MGNFINLDAPFFDNSTGEPLALGKVYFGMPGADPKTNTKTPYTSLSPLTATTATQTLTASGKFSARLYLVGDYSLIVEDAEGNQILSYDNVEAVNASEVSILFETVADMVASTTLNVGDRVEFLEYYSGYGGGNRGTVVAAGTGTADGFEYIDLATHKFKAKVDSGIFDVRQAGAKSDLTTDAYTAINTVITKAKNSSQATVTGYGTFLTSAQLDFSQVDVVGRSVYALVFKAHPTFSGESVAILGSLSQHHYYGRFQIDGNQDNTAGTIDGLILEGNVLHNTLQNIEITECSGDQLVLRNGAGGTTRPTENIFHAIRLIDGGGRGLYYTSGRQNTFVGLNAEQLGEEGIYIDGTVAPTDQPQNTTFLESWVEETGQNHLVSGGVDAVRCQAGFAIGFKNLNIVNYGSAASDTGHGIHILDSYYVTIETPGAGLNRGGVYAAASAPIRLQGGARHRLIGLPSSIPTAYISVSSSDYSVESAWSETTNDGTNIFIANQASIAGNTSTWIQPSTGLQLSLYSDARLPVSGRCTIVKMSAETTTLPGGTETIDITLEKNSVTTAIATQLTNANGGTDTDSAEVTFDPGDFLSIKVDTSASAATIPAGGLHVSLMVMNR